MENNIIYHFNNRPIFCLFPTRAKENQYKTNDYDEVSQFFSERIYIDKFKNIYICSLRGVFAIKMHTGYFSE